ncbi:ComEC/Rec2-related protein [Spirochaeta africana DSM 8902]|uniref:ComEC/Rec2-related protein n=2 Tax=Spirochaeta TaxID=146 RepID=H9UL50_SPIAZ|nr:ComEC/Rec2-related protein [Spirochaeta africana DSM 8902]
MTILRRPPAFPVVAAAGTAVGMYLFGSAGGLAAVFLPAAVGAGILPLYRRTAVFCIACGLGAWIALIPQISDRQDFLPFPPDQVALVTGTAAGDSRTASSGAIWFPLQIDAAQTAHGETGTARSTARVLYRTGPAVAAGQRVQVHGRLNEGGWLQASHLQPLGWAGQGARYRAALRTRLQRELRLVSPATAGLAEALLLGRLDSMEPEVRELFETTGTLHLLALSGMHLGILVGGPVVLLRRLAGQRTALLAGLLLMLMFVWIIGPRSSLLRAGGFFALAACWMLSGRRVHSPTVLAQVFLLLAVFGPSLPAEIGFQLSFAAVAGILLFSPPLLSFMYNRLPAAGRPLYGSLAAGVGASVAGLPVAAMVWGVWYPIGIILTLLAVPLITLIMYLCLLLLAGYGLLLPALLLSPLETAAAYLVRGLLGILGGCAGLGRVPLGGMPGAVVTAMVVTAALLPVVWWQHTRVRLCEESCITAN